MSAPYRLGQELAWIAADPEGVRVYRANVATIDAASDPDRWLITTDYGNTAVDRSGVGAHAIPLEPDIAEDLYVYGDGYLVSSTVIDLGPDSDQDRGIDLGDDLGPA